MKCCNNPIRQGPTKGRACGYEVDHEQPCVAEIICKTCGDGIHPDSSHKRCRACRNKYGEDKLEINQGIIDAVTAWSKVIDELDKYEDILEPLVKQEMELRKKVMEIAFPNGKEGTNNLEIWPGWTLKGTIKINRKVDEAALPAVKAQLQEIKVNADALIRWKAEVALKEYRGLTAEQQKIFEQCLEIKPAAPTLELVSKEDETKAA